MAKKNVSRLTFDRRGMMKLGMAAGASAMLGHGASAKRGRDSDDDREDSSGGGGGSDSPNMFGYVPFTQNLPLPPVKEPKSTINWTPGDCYHGCAPEYWDHPADWDQKPTKFYETSIEESVYEMIPGVQTPVFGYDGMVPGPTYRARFGEPMVIRYTNQMVVETSVHQHGGHLPAHSDGFPNFYILPGRQRDYYYPNIVPKEHGEFDMTEVPSTMWYHDHGMDITGHNVNMGLAGFFLFTDDFEEDLMDRNILPHIDGDYDIPLVIQDKKLNDDGTIFYDFLDHNGYMGNLMLANGAVQPKLHVERRKYRFRILCAGDSRIWMLKLSHGKMLQIATDSWLLPHATLEDRIMLSVAQRADIIVDFRDAPDEVYLENIMQQTDGRGPDGVDESNPTPLIKFVVGGGRVSNDCTVTVGTPLRPHVPIHEEEITATREFVFERSNGAWKINGLFFNPERADAVPRQEGAERWILKNKSGGWWHPIHIHLEAHQQQRINGRTPPFNRRFKSDTALLTDNGEIELFMKFRTFTGPFVFHCHNLEHEDMRMMTTFDPRPAGTSRPMGPDGRPKIPAEVSGMPEGWEDSVHMFAEEAVDTKRDDKIEEDNEVIGETTAP